MIFGNPNALWLLFIVILVSALGFWGLKVKREIINDCLFKVDTLKIRRSQIKKYILAAAILISIIIAMALPRMPILLPGGTGKTGLIVPMVDVTRSMAAKANVEGPNRLERVKPLLYEIIDRFPEAEFYPFYFTSLARSFTPPVTKEDFPYLKRSIARVLQIGSVPGSGSNLGKALSEVIDKISEDERPKIIVIFSDGESYASLRYASESDKEALEIAIRKANADDIKIVTVGVGEIEGAPIPLYDEEGKFTGKYVEEKGEIYVSHLKKDVLKRIADRTGGKYFFEDDIKGIVNYIESNLSSGDSEEEAGYQDIGYLFLFLLVPCWIFFARYYLK